MRETNIQSIEKRVYELERNGGGGGTSNYEQLTNRPEIEGKTLSGNMTFEDLGIASAVDLAQTDGDLQDLADKFSPIYYTDEDAALDVVLHTVITDSNLPTNEARVFVVKCDKGWFICNAQRSTDNYTGMAIQQSGTDRYTFHGSIGGAQTIITPFTSGGGIGFINTSNKITIGVASDRNKTYIATDDCYASIFCEVQPSKQIRIRIDNIPISYSDIAYANSNDHTIAVTNLLPLKKGQKIEVINTSDNNYTNGLYIFGMN